MKNIFLSYHYDEPNRQLARQVEDLVESHNLRAVTGDVLGGGGLTVELKRQITQADALVALLTRDTELPAGGWTTHEFCKTELQHARSIEKPAIAFVEDGVAVHGLFQEHEFIPYNATAPLSAFLRLSRTIWRWKMRAGRTLKIQVVPEAVAQEIWAMQAHCRWEYRLSSGLDETEWQTAKPRKEPGGLFLYVQVPDETMLIEVRIQSAARSWTSDAVAFHMPLTLVGG